MRTEAEFWQSVVVSAPDECWKWGKGAGHRGYGSVHWRGKQDRSHRVAYQLSHPVEDITGKLICHSCDNPPCCNPAHLFSGTSLDNVRDRFAKNRFVGESAPNARFKNEDVFAIRRAYDTQGVTVTELAKQHGSSVGAIRHIVHRETWKSLPEAAILNQK